MTPPSRASWRPKVLRLGIIESAFDAWKQVEEIAEIVVPESTNREDFIKECRSGAFDGATIAYRTFDSVKITGRIDSEFIDALPASLIFICHNGTFSIRALGQSLTDIASGAGYDQIDIAACSNRAFLEDKPPIRVSNTPTAVDDATADIGIWLMLGALRNLNSSITSLRKGEWRGKRLPALGHDPQGKVLGILGMGGIGRNMARKARVFGMKIQYHNRKPIAPELEAECEARYVNFDELLKTSDVISLNLPLNDNTRHIISTPQFEIMKKGVVVVNTARGAVIDENALVAALDKGHVASAGLDVYENEPQVHEGLLANPNVLIVPHMGTWTEETQTKMEEWTISNVVSAIKQGELRSIVPEQKIPVAGP
ncbi:hypothetical protein BN1708_005525 [Verticillium longisporum]|uniref:D-isomer specific 2-hydroxyacid dehydrogenase NAD-binding domain-containing protein n=1 Tax=Verticillium longisporum TaxID=100787 RepID=A0A0G4MBR2_VERLO|nr:hypothetical protein BN1708_005525 [Verticillium longisporum]